MLRSCWLVVLAAAEPALEVVKPEPAKEAPRAVQVVSDVPDRDKPQKSRQHVERMREVLGKVLKYLEDARDDKDVIKLNCINEKLTSIKALLKISEQADVAMQEGLARRNAEVVQHEFEKISIAAMKCDQLLAESEVCIGELSVFAGDTEVEMTVDGEVPGDLADNIPVEPIIVRPPAASPYQ